MKLLLVTDTGETVEARCSDCRHWGKGGMVHVKESGYDPVTFEEGPDYKHAEPAGHRVCNRVPWPKDTYMKPKKAERLAFVTDIDESGAQLETRAAFGCVLFERKETT